MLTAAKSSMALSSLSGTATTFWVAARGLTALGWHYASGCHTGAQRVVSVEVMAMVGGVRDGLGLCGGAGPLSQWRGAGRLVHCWICSHSGRSPSAS
jgi:hypothetical protein